MKLLIVESPTKIQTIKSALDSSWEVIASFGHIRDLPKKEMGVEAPDFRPKYEANERSSRTIAKIITLAKQADDVYLATDPDREGESIAWHIKEACGLKSPKRVKFNELTKQHILSRLHSPGIINGKLVLAQEARRVDDRLTGYLVSPEISAVYGSTLSAGRVQSTALRLVAERELAIRHFQPTDHYSVLLSFGAWTAEWRTSPFVTDDRPYLLDLEFASRVAALTEFSVIGYEQKISLRQPPAPFTTSTLQQAGSVSLKMKTSDTMRVAQSLFEKHHITYHRTDRPNLAEEAIAEIFAYCKENGLPVADKPRTWKAKESAQEAHEAIRPTDFSVTNAGDTPEEKSLYRMIWQRAVASQMAPAKYAVRVAEIQSVQAIDGQQMTFDARGKALIEPGWLSLTKGDQSEEDAHDAELDNPIPRLSVGGALRGEGQVTNKRTKSPARFSDASLVKALEERGIGRPSTYASIIETLLDRQYVTMDGRQRLSCSEVGMKVFHLLMDKFSFMDFEYTRKMEDHLDDIAVGQAKYLDVVSASYATLVREVSAFKQSSKPRFPCPVCGRGLMRVMPSEDGKKPFWGCSGYPACNTTLPDDNGKPGVRNQPAHSQFNCTCGKPLIRRKKVGVGKNKGYDFFGCSGFPACPLSFPAKAGKPDYDHPRVSQPKKG